MKNNIETPLEQVFTYGVGTTSEDIQGNDKAYFNLKAHAMKTAKKAILADLLEIIGEMEHSTVVSKEDIEDELDGGNAVTIKQKATTFKNQLRQELREKVKEYCK